MRIAFITTEYVTEPNFAGGLASYTHRIASSLLNLGHETEVFVPSSISELSESIEHKGVIVHRVGKSSSRLFSVLESFQRHLLNSFFENHIDLLERGSRLNEALRNRSREAPFDLVHYTHLGGLGAWRGRTPSIVRLSSYRDLWIPFGFPFSSVFERFVEDLALRRADAVFAPSHLVAEYVATKIGHPVEVIESPFTPVSQDTSAAPAPRADAPPPVAAPYGLFFGSLSEWKGVLILAEAVREFLEARPDFTFQIIGNDICGGAVRRRVLDILNPVRDRVILRPALRHDELFPIIASADFVALPSLVDNFPNACIEAMWCGRTVIGTRGASFEQLIEDGVSGLLCKPGDPVSLLAAMNRAAALGNEARAEIGDAARKRIDRLEPAKIAQEVVAFYERAISSRARRV